MIARPARTVDDARREVDVPAPLGSSDDVRHERAAACRTEGTVLTDAQRAAVQFDDRGLVLAVVQQHDTGEVLMVAWMDAVALASTIEGGEAVFYSRSRQQQWHKGATSGNVQRVVELRVDCDGDALLVLVDQGGDGVACHTGQRSCFHHRLPGAPAGDAVAAPPLATTDPPAADPPAADPPPSRPAGA